MAPQSAEALKLTAEDLINLKVVDEVIPEPIGGAHCDPEQTALNVKVALEKHILRLCAKSPEQLLKDRFNKYRVMGEYSENRNETASDVSHPS